MRFPNRSGPPFDFSPTESCLNCHSAAKGMPRNLVSEAEEEEGFGPSFLWGSVFTVASLGGLLFSSESSSAGAVTTSGKETGVKDVILDGNSCLLNTRAMENDGSDGHEESNENHVGVGYSFDHLLKISIAASKPEILLYTKTREVDASEFSTLINSQLSILKTIVEELLASRVVTNVSISKTHPQYQRYLEALSIAGNKEIDAVILLQWISDIIAANRERMHLVWPKLHGKSLSVCLWMCVCVDVGVAYASQQVEDACNLATVPQGETALTSSLPSVQFICLAVDYIIYYNFYPVNSLLLVICGPSQLILFQLFLTSLPRLRSLPGSDRRAGGCSVHKVSVLPGALYIDDPQVRFSGVCNVR